MSIKVETPPTLSGQTEERVTQLFRYLFRLSESLNVALNNIEKDSISTNALQAAGGSSVAAAEKTESGSTYNELRSLIKNTAEYVKAEEDRLEQEFGSRYTAISSEWGKFTDTVSNTIETTARGIVQSFGYDSQLESLQSEASRFAEYIVHTEGFIKQGFIDYDDNGVPIIGIAIGQNLTSVEVDGVQKIDANQSCAFYTADKVSFRINGQEVAYVSNRKLYIGDVEITGSIAFGDWHVFRTNGLVIKWTGE